MKWIRTTTAVTGAAALLCAAAFAPAQALTVEETTPETPTTNPSLPVVHTYRGSDHIKANILNPRPVCNPWEDRRTVIYKATDKFSPVGTISTTNTTARDIPLTQTLSKSQSISMTVNGSQTQTVGINGSGSQQGVQAGISYSLAKTIGGQASYSLSWNVGQQVGPYPVSPGYTGEATYGFRTITMTGTQQYCKPNGTWSNPTAWTSFAPIKNEVRIKHYQNPIDSRN